MNASKSCWKHLFSAAVTLFLNGCVESQSRIDSLGLAVGDRVHLGSKVSTFKCKPDVTITGLWSGKAKLAACLAEKSRGTAHMPGEQPYTGTGTLQVEKIVHRNGIDSSFYWILVREIPSDEIYWIGDYDVPGLFDKPGTP